MKIQSALMQAHNFGQPDGARNVVSRSEPRGAPATFESSDRPPFMPFGVPTSYASKPHGRLCADPLVDGVFRDDKWQAFIKRDNQTYPVKYDKDNATWRVHNPQNPLKFQCPVRRNENGSWLAHSDVGLKGGGPVRVLLDKLRDAQRDYDRAKDEVRRRQAAADTTYQEAYKGKDFLACLEQPPPQIRESRENLNSARGAVEAAGERFRVIQQEARSFASQMERECTSLSTERAKSRELERTTLDEIRSLETAMHMSDQPSAQTQSLLRTRQIELQRIQNAIRDLDAKIAEANDDMRNFARH
ncbi:hypothetical protein PQR14_13415 [Paraburkholderia bryophila]|uniref:hypothetical protein n=1 Tax=Paraburkholderia bryophila TaxID=420952 RepID=UPI0038BB7CE6